jgi:tetratricopeptide (TPR) repeat protein
MSPAPSSRALARLPQTSETWQVFVAQLRTWITEPDEAPFRPHAVFVIDLDNGFVVGSELLRPAQLPDGIADALTKAMRKPLPGAGSPRRPATIVAPPDQVEAIITGLARHKLEMDIVEGEPPEEITQLVGELEAYLRNNEEEHPGLLSVKGVTPNLVGGLFAAAAEFYRAAPWIQLDNSHVLAVRHPAEPRPRFASVMGNGGVEYGLAMYLQWADVERMFTGVDDPMEVLPESGGHSLLFGTAELVPFDDLDAIERYGWEVLAEDAYPLPIVYQRDSARRPELMDLLWYEAALRAIPIFLSQHLHPDAEGDYAPATATIEVPTHAGLVKVDVSYPAGDVPLATRPVRDVDWPSDDGDDEAEDAPFIDQRAMEGMMAQLAASMDTGGGQGDPDLDRAQQLMYQAWEQTNPARRIALAHEALSISPKCADAYVLLAEEEADTLGRALKYYEEGVAAGERALGPDYFKEFKGHFWGLIETRPYMRAREGLANTLWGLNRKNEAAAHYTDLLRLNPNDNQGVRYALLDLLLEIDRGDEAAKLIRKYRDDWSSTWTYTRALLEFRTGGASSKSDKALSQALEQNPHVPDYLTGKKRIPNRLPEFIGLGDENEAIDYAAKHLNHWRRTPGAVEWLAGKVSAVARPMRTRRKPTAQGKSGRTGKKTSKKGKRK